MNDIVIQPINSRTLSTPQASDSIPAERADGTEIRVTVRDIQMAFSPTANLMLKNIYDINNLGIVDNSQSLGGNPPSYYTNLANMTGTLPQANITGLAASLSLKEDIANKGGTNGYAPLVGGLIPLIHIPFVGTQYQGLYNATTNIPAILNGVGTAGDFYIANVTGNAYAPVNVTIVNQIVAYDGAVWQVGAVAAASVSSVNALTGAVLLTSANVPDSANKRYITSDTFAAAVTATQASVNPATALNRLATLNDISTPSIQITSEWHTFETYAKGITTGDGTLRLLNTITNPRTGVAFTNADLPTDFPLANGRGALVTTWTLDDIVQECAFRACENATSYAQFMAHDNKYYVLNVGHDLPRTAATSSAFRSYNIRAIGNGSVVVNGSGLPLVLWNRMPANQNDAVNIANNYIAYKFMFDGWQFNGANLLRGSGDVAIRMGASYSPLWQNCKFNNFDTGLQGFFALEGAVQNCEFNDNAYAGIDVTNGNWSGADIPNSGSNGFSVSHTKFRCAPDSFAGYKATNSDGIQLAGGENVMEGSMGAGNAHSPLYHFYYDGGGATVNKRILIENIHIEQSVQNSHIYIADYQQTMYADIGRIFLQEDPATVPSSRSLVECDTTGVSGGIIQVNLYSIPDNTVGWQCRSVGNGYNAWFYDRARLNNQASLTAAINWDTTTRNGRTGVIPPASRLFMTNAGYPLY